MRSFNHNITLRMEQGFLCIRDSKEQAQFFPQGGGELCFTIWSKDWWNSKPENPILRVEPEHSLSTPSWRDWWERDNLWLSSIKIHGKKIKVPENGRGPTRSTWRWLNLLLGTRICKTLEWMWVWILLFWQDMQEPVHRLTSLDRFSRQINLREA